MNKEERRREYLHILVTENEKETIKQLAKENNLNLSNYIRLILLKNAKEKISV